MTFGTVDLLLCQGLRVQILQDILRTLFAKFPSEHGNCDLGTWEFGWKNLHVQMKMLLCIDKCNSASSIYRWECHFRVLTVELKFWVKIYLFLNNYLD
jgi:hypothetical protein